MFSTTATTGSATDEIYCLLVPLALALAAFALAMPAVASVALPAGLVAYLVRTRPRR